MSGLAGGHRRYGWRFLHLRFRLGRYRECAVADPANASRTGNIECAQQRGRQRENHRELPFPI